MTYRELDEEADLLARRLVSCGAAPEEVVALFLPRGQALITAMLAVAKSGAAFVPIDLEAPRDRIRFVCQDIRPLLVVHLAEQRDPWPVACLDRLILDDPGPAYVGMSVTGDVHRTNVRTEHPAYVLYTSGSTGTPKGVLVTHSGIAGLARTGRELMQACRGSRVLQLATPGFDIAVIELCVALLCGGVLVVAPADRLRPGPALAELCTEQRVTHLMISPTALSVLPTNALPTVKVLVLGAEAVPQALVARWAPGRTVLDGYGPTETTVCATLSNPLDGSVPPPIGRAIPGVRCYVLDAELAQVTIGQVGELYVGGGGLARGYVNSPGATAGRFVANPFSTAGERMYRTGDLVRVLADEELAFAGRSDDQVKLNGIRIEPGEIEAALGAHPEVHACAVSVREDTPGIRSLVAYVVAGTGRLPDASELRAHLRRELPEAVIPSRYVSLAELPRTLNGKIDRRALPGPSTTVAARRLPDGADPMLTEVRRIWCEVLGHDTVGFDEPFFEAGGTSLLLIRLHQRLTAELGLRIEVADLLDHPTIRAFTEHRTPRHSPGRRPQERVDTFDDAPPTAADISVLAPSGLRIEGLLLAQAAELIRAVDSLTA
ncbi:amino acid adenylation domain-containing protein [Streptomyces spectabilis]|uniref:Amino acid adenylation domain-containing protein n=1 Tax=Streptomyces spectabilis TaxID=68270 RepID=A0A7W8B3K0_STRST|nr:amino acid adenylation domain-containing protein [Streptomyces spectabilis]